MVVPQAAAYAQIAGLPPSAGLVAAPGALLGYALLGTSRTLVVGATTLRAEAVLELLRRSGVAEKVRVEPTLDGAVSR